MVNLKDICLTTYIKIPFLIDQLQLGAGRIFIIANISVKQMSYTIPVSSQKPTATTDKRLQMQIPRDSTQLWLLIYFLKLKVSIPKLTSVYILILPAKRSQIRAAELKINSYSHQ